MRKLYIFVLVLIVTLVGLGWCEDTPPARRDVIPCPKTTMVSDCLTCHVVSGGKFMLRETSPDAHLVYPTDSMHLIVGDGKAVGYFLLSDVDAESISRFFDYLWQHDVKKAIIEIHSPGGALFEAQRVIGIFRYWQSKGIVIETRLFGAAFSAAFYIFVAGDIRLVDKYSDLMWHEVQSFSGFGFRIETPSDKEESARILRHLQDVRNEYLSTRGKLSKKEIDEKIKKLEFWMSGADAVRYGFADGFTDKKPVKK